MIDGLSAAASGIAVVGIAIRLADSVQKLCDFWTSVKDAPEDISCISAELTILSSVLARVAQEAQHNKPDLLLESALKSCRSYVSQLINILNKVEPGFASNNARIRKWSAIKAVFKKAQVTKFQDALERTKSTLMLMQQIQDRYDMISFCLSQEDLLVVEIVHLP